VSLIDDIKDLFSTHAHRLEERMHGIENHLDAIEGANNRVAERLDFELLNQIFAIPAATPKGALATAADLLLVPQGSFYELLGWSYSAPANERPALLTGGQVFDTSDGIAAKVGKSTTANRILPPGSLLEAMNTEAEQETQLLVQFKVYQEAALFKDSHGGGD
jgi:hypothetical protein